MRRRNREEEELDQMIAQDILEVQAREMAKKKAMQEAIIEQQKQNTVVSTSQDIKENMGQVEKAIRNDEALPSDVKDDLIIESTNDRKVQESAARNLNMRSAPQSDGSIKSQFLDALTFFGPQIIGGLFGAAEGDAGMLAGAEIGGKLRDSYIDYNFKRQDQERERQRIAAQQVGTQQIISQPFRLNDGSGWAFPRKVIDQATGQPVVKFYKEDGTEVSSSEVSEPQDARIADYQKLKKRGLEQQDLKIAEASVETFKKTGPVKKRLDQLTEIQRVQDLIDSNMPFKGLLESAIAKGLGGEVGNLAVEERKAAAQIVGWRGKLEDFKEFTSSQIGSLRKEEIRKLLEYIKPAVRKRLYEDAERFSKPRAERYRMDQEAYRMYLLDSTGHDFSDMYQQPKSQNAEMVERQKKILDRIRKAKGRK